MALSGSGPGCPMSMINRFNSIKVNRLHKSLCKHKITKRLSREECSIYRVVQGQLWENKTSIIKGKYFSQLRHKIILWRITKSQNNNNREWIIPYIFLLCKTLPSILLFLPDRVCGQHTNPSQKLSQPSTQINLFIYVFRKFRFFQHCKLILYFIEKDIASAQCTFSLFSILT